MGDHLDVKNILVLQNRQETRRKEMKLNACLCKHLHKLALANGSTGFNHLMFPKWFVGLNLGTNNPLTIGIDAENQWACLFRCQS
jgi:hypothetical protein